MYVVFEIAFDFTKWIQHCLFVDNNVLCYVFRAKKNTEKSFKLQFFIMMMMGFYFFYCSCCWKWKRHCQASSLARDLPFMYMQVTHFCDMMKLYYLVMEQQKKPKINLMLFPLHRILQFLSNLPRMMIYILSIIYTHIWVCMCMFLFLSWKHCLL